MYVYEAFTKLSKCIEYSRLIILLIVYIVILLHQTEGSSTQTMGRVILECEHFVPAIVKFITMNVNTDGAVSSSEPYLVSHLYLLSLK